MLEEIDIKPLTDLSPISSPQNILCMLNGIIEEERKDIHGNPVDVALLAKKFDQYAAWWKAKYGHWDTKYIGKNKRMEMEDFISSRYYNNDFTAERSDRDKYFFGDISNEELIKRTRVFIDETYRKPIPAQPLSGEKIKLNLG